MITTELLIAAAIIFVVICTGLGLLLQRKTRKLHAKVEALTVLVKDGDKQKEVIKRELQELRSGTIGVGRRVLELEKKLQQQDAKLDEANQQDPQARLYSRAMKMVDLGAGIDELIQECELPKAEAELLIRLHRKE